MGMLRPVVALVCTAGERAANLLLLEMTGADTFLHLHPSVQAASGSPPMPHRAAGSWRGGV